MTAAGRRDASLVKTGDTYSLLLEGRSYEVSFGERAGGEQTVYVNGRAVRLSPGARNRNRQTSAAATVGPVPVLAPMPGRIVKVLVQPGDQVAARQGLIVVEAMKMENELRAPRAGTVTEVKVAEGALVEARALLVTIE